jgi:DNA repair protein RadC
MLHDLNRITKDNDDLDRETPYILGENVRLRQTLSPQEEHLVRSVVVRHCNKNEFERVIKQIRKSFPTFSDFVAAPAPLLLNIPGVRASLVDECRFVIEATGWLAKAKMPQKRTLQNGDDVISYLRIAMAYLQREQFRIIFLDTQRGMICDEVHSEGTIDHATVYVREVLKRSLELSAAWLVLAHNHPSGDSNPSLADIQLTKGIISAGRPLGVQVADHIILSRTGYLSMRQKGMI